MKKSSFITLILLFLGLNQAILAQKVPLLQPGQSYSSYLMWSAARFNESIVKGDIAKARKHLAYVDALLGSEPHVVVKTVVQTRPSKRYLGLKQVETDRIDYTLDGQRSFEKSYSFAPEDFLENDILTTLLWLGFEDCHNTIGFDRKKEFLKAYLQAMTNSFARSQVDITYIQKFNEVLLVDFQKLSDCKVTVEDLIVDAQIAAQQDSVDADNCDFLLDSDSSYQYKIYAGAAVSALAALAAYWACKKS
jgi:hypothetical protein